MSFVLVRPTAQHKPGNVLSATTEDGLTVVEPEPSTSNKGNLRLRVSGVPTAAETITLQLSNGGYPAGYDVAALTSGSTTGAAVQWKRPADSGYRGYNDTPAVSSVLIPFTYSATVGQLSTPRELPDGALGFLGVTSNAVSLYKVSTAGVGSTVSVSACATGTRADMVVMPSGRLVAIFRDQTNNALLTTRYSDDSGANWSSLGTSLMSTTKDVLCAERVGDDIVLIRGTTSSATTYISISRDGGATFTDVTSTTLENPRTCVLDGVVYLASRSITTMWVYPIVPGGGLGSAVNTSASASAWGCIAARDDGALWTFGWAPYTLDLEMSVSDDANATWTQPANSAIKANGTAYATDGYDNLSAGMWGARMVIVGRVNSSAGSDGGIHVLMLGEWSNIAQPVCATMATPIDYLQNLGWTKVDTGAGSTVTNQGPWRFVTAVANYSVYTAPAALWAPAVAAVGYVQFGLKVNSGGSLAANNIRAAISIGDGANTQGLNIRFAATGARCYDTTGTQVGTDLTATLTTYTEFRVTLAHDYPAAGAGKVSISYRTLGSELWSAWLTGEVVTEQAGTSLTQLRFGTTTGSVADYELTFYGTNDAAASTYAPGTATPPGRTLSAAYDYRLVSGINLGAYGTGGGYGDTYALTAAYTYGAVNVWTELRPSRRAQSAADGGNWALSLDSGSADLFHGDTVALFGTNMRTATWEMSSSSTYATTPISVSLNATLTNFILFGAGPGYVTSRRQNWRPGQWKSNGDNRRYFLDLAGVVYEITDNDEDHIYVAGVDLTGATGTAYIFGDRMAARLPQYAQYRYARVSVGPQDTSDGKYRIGTPIFDGGFTPEQLYDFGFVDRLEPNVTTTDADSGSSLSYRRGPALASLSIQWPPLDRLRIDAEERIADFYRACEGSLTPVVLWRDTGDLFTLSLVQIRETLTRTNVRGEGPDALTRIDQLVLREVW